MILKKIVSFLLLTLMVSVMMASAFFSRPVQAQTSVGNVCVVSTPTDKPFPQVQVQFRALDLSNHAVQGLTRTGVKITENNKEIPPSLELVKNANGVGLNLFFVVDQGNRTNQGVAKAILQRYGDAFMADGLDNAAIITDLTLPAPSFHTYQDKTSSKARFVNAASQFPINDSKAPLSSISTLREAISQIRSLNAGCGKPSAIVLLTGEDVELYRDPNVVSTVIADATSLGVPIHVVHIPDALGTFGGEEVLKQISSGTKGIYTQAKNVTTQAYTGSDQELFQKLVADRVTYTAEFRSSDGTSGDHTITVQGVGQSTLSSAGTTRLTVKIDPPAITITSPNDGFIINRTAKNATDPFEWDIDTQKVEFTVEFPDKVVRDLKTADLKISNSTGTQTALSITPGSGNKFQMDWDLKEIKNAGGNPFVLQVWVTDELGVTSKSNPINVQVNVVIPSPIAGITSPGSVIPWALIVGGGGLAILIVSIIAVSAIRKASKKIPDSVAPEEGLTVTSNSDGSGPLASILVLAGPGELRNQKIPINMPMVTLGRGSRADIQFKLGDHSSVSREHITLTKNDRGWSISPIVASKGETTLNGQRLSRGEVYPIDNGDHIQLGTVGYNHVEFEFISEGTGLDTDTSVTQVPGEVENDADEYVPLARNYKQVEGETQVDIVDVPSTISKKDREQILRKGDKGHRSNDDWLNSL